MSNDQALSIDTIGELYEANHGWLVGWLNRKLGCRSTAADLAQDTFLRILTKRDLPAIEVPRAYLTTVAHGLMVNMIRRRELESAYLAELALLPEADTPSPETRAIVLETLVKLDAMLDGLAPKVRRAFLLQQLEGLTHAAIAEQLHVSVSSVRQYIAKAMLHCLALQEEPA